MRPLAGLSLLLVIPVLVAACDKPSTDSKPSATAEPAPTLTASAPAPPAESESPPTASAEPSAAPSASAAEAPAPKATASAKAPSTTAAVPERKVKTVGGTSASGDGFSVGISARSPVRAGESSNASIVLTAKPPYHCNAKYPYKMALDAPGGGVSYPQNPVKGMSVSEKSGSMAVPFKASQKGKATISGTLSFSVCTEDKCLIEKRALSVTVDVD